LLYKKKKSRPVYRFISWTPTYYSVGFFFLSYKHTQTRIDPTERESDRKEGEKRKKKE